MNYILVLRYKYVKKLLQKMKNVKRNTVSILGILGNLLKLYVEIVCCMYFCFSHFNKPFISVIFVRNYIFENTSFINTFKYSFLNVRKIEGNLPCFVILVCYLVSQFHLFSIICFLNN